MIYFLKGMIFELQPFYVILDVNNIGYKIKITLDTYQKLLNSMNESILLYTRLIYKEDSRTLYGFLSKEEGELFDFITELHGIGPQLASNLISTLGIDGFLQAIESNDLLALSQTPKIGKNKAEKILLESNQKSKKVTELKNKIFTHSNLGTTKIMDTKKVLNINEYFLMIEESLLHLGFNKKEIDNAYSMLRKKEENLPPETKENIQDWIKLCLKYL